MQRAGATLAGLALTATTAAVAAPPVGRQAQYDAAQAAMDRGDWVTAAAGFRPLLPADPDDPLSRSQALIAARRGEALAHEGEAEEARSLLHHALAAMPHEPALAGNWVDAADAARIAYDYDLAIAAGRTAVDLASAAKEPSILALARLGLAQAAMTVDPGTAAAALDLLLASDKALAPPARAQLEALRARAAIIAGDRPAARRWIGSALTHSGGLTDHDVSSSQIEIRADAGIIARLAGDDEEARRYLAFTGAGHFQHMDWIGRYQGELPTCDAAAGPRPDDSVVVRFAIGADGAVQAAVPVYASRPGNDGALFAETVSHWRWVPDELKATDPFARATLRLELRCQRRPVPAALQDPFIVQTADWLARGHHLDPAALATITNGPDRQQAVAQSHDQLVAALFGTSNAERGTALPYAEAQQLLVAAAAPSATYAMLAYVATRAQVSGWGIRATAAARAAAFARLVPPLMARFPRDRAIAWLMLEWALALESSGGFAAAAPLLAQVLALPDEALPADDPVRQVAALHTGLVGARLGKPAAAAATAALDPKRCALFDTHPIPASVTLSSATFPADALRWGFGGHVEEEFDIGSDGRVGAVRTLLAYPPFIFGPNTEHAIHGFRYVPPAINGRAVGCDSQRLRINYQVPK